MVSVQVFQFTGAAQTTLVPSGTALIVARLFGAQGGSGANQVQGGLGGQSSFNFPASGPFAPNSTLQINVGGQGQIATIGGGPGGFNGGASGGNGVSGGQGGGGGGGASDVRSGSFTLNERSIVAGGGGGVGGSAIPSSAAGTGGSG